MITVNIRKQGGAAIMTIPSDVLKMLNVEVGASLELEVTGGAFTARPARPAARKRYTLAELLRARRRKTWPHSKWTPPGRARANQSAARWHDSPAGREIKDRHRFVVITPKAINALGIAMTVPVTSAGTFARDTGLTVPIMGHDTTGVAVCNQVRSFDIEARERAGTARYVETLDTAIAEDIVSRVISVIDPAG